MFPRPIVITTLEEDFKKIGILVESEKPVVEPVVEADEDDNEPIEGQENMSEEELAELRVRRRTAKGKRTLKPTKRTPTRLKIKAKRYYRKFKKALKRAFKKRMRKPVMRKRAKVLAKRAKSRREGQDTISNLIEDVQDIVNSLGGSGSQDAIKSFANIAIISDMLANTFTEWTNDITESEDALDDETFDNLKAAVENLADLAEAAAEIATALKEGHEIDGDMDLIFREYMADMLAGMDIYNEATKKTETDDGDEDDAEGDEDEDEDEDDDDEKEEGKMPDFIKKKIAAKDDSEDDDDEDEKEESVPGDKEDSLKKTKK